MKQLLKSAGFKGILTLLYLAIVQVAVLAQDAPQGESTTTTTTRTETTTWYSSPWLWIVGGAVFILLLVALVRGGSSKQSTSASDRVTVTKTVTRE